MSDSVSAIQFKEVGVDYCTVHHGIRNEDEQWCNSFGQDDCPRCEGSGYDEDDSDCPRCENYGVTLCCLIPLGYMHCGNGRSADA